MILDSLPKQDRLRGFADALGFVTHNLFNSMKNLKPILDVIARISALYLNVAKCVIVPLWKYQESAIRDALNDVCPGWHTMKIAEVAKYLGFWIGPGTGDRDWDGIMDTLGNVGRAIRGAGLPRLMAFRSFLAYGVSHLIFVAQLRRPPTSLHELELQNICNVIREPGLWAPAAFVYYLKDWGLFPC